ncbi:ribonuclease P protein component [Calothrix sp. UHCC 0171]|uniref:ribonuclease P protein component n=1 Tax=Calothrix sp. UHCC 0171 TaxID=3110245 RepID=UPI002B1EB811|nr:ribonuclease P protein component [Calothrix sp. UHCC 0171]MEA5571482.1 ribonuclease P protein component [Calothrix sp. UHCC 0171]
MALPSVHRLKSRHDFQAVFREGTRRHGSYMTLRALRPSQDAAINTTNLGKKEKNNNLPARIGISISTKVSKRAVVRNRIKRRISAALQKLLPKLSPGWRLVVVVKPTAAQEECVTQQFLQELEQLLVQAEVFNGYS